MTADFRKASELRNENRNQELWLMGMYVYEAILDNVPVLRAFGKKGAKPKPFSEKPYAITAAAIKRQKEEKEKARFEKAKLYMQNAMLETRKKFSGGTET